MEAKSKPGIKTTEFWVTVITTSAMTILAAMGKIPGDVAAGLTAGAGAVYTGSRVVVKK